MSPDIITAIIGLVGTIGGAAIGFVSSFMQNKKRRRVEKALTKQSYSIDFADRFATSAELIEEIHSIQRDTELDRFLLLVAWNGVAAPEKCSALFQIRSGVQEYRIYKNVPLDDDYVSKLAYIKNGNSLLVKTEQEQKSLIKGIYQDEGVTESLWSLVIRLDNGFICYCSNSTHKGSIQESSLTRVNLLVARLQEHAKSFQATSDSDR